MVAGRRDTHRFHVCAPTNADDNHVAFRVFHRLGESALHHSARTCDTHDLQLASCHRHVDILQTRKQMRHQLIAARHMEQVQSEWVA